MDGNPPSPIDILSGPSFPVSDNPVVIPNPDDEGGGSLLAGTSPLNDPSADTSARDPPGSSCADNPVTDDSGNGFPGIAPGGASGGASGASGGSIDGVASGVASGVGR